MTLHDFTGAQPALLLSSDRGNCIWWSEEVDVVVAGWTVTFRQAKIVLANREKRLLGMVGKPISLN